MTTSTKKNGKNNKNGNDLCRNKKLFLEKYPEYGSVGETLKAIGVKSRTTFYNWCKKDHKFEKVYLTELLPNRRDECVSLMYRYATGRLGKETKTYTNRKGETWSEEVPVSLPDTQVRALFGMLKATDHSDTGEDRLIFIEKHQLVGANGGPIEVEHDVKPKLLGMLNRLITGAGKAETDTESEREGS